MLYASKRNDYERVKILFRYGYRLERIDRITDPLKRIEIFKAITSPAYVVATLENVNDVSSEFFCPVKRCFEFASEASAKAKATPEYKKEYAEIERRSVISLFYMICVLVVKQLLLPPILCGSLKKNCSVMDLKSRLSLSVSRRRKFCQSAAAALAAAIYSK